MKIAILGTRGIPANYSGFETSVEETSVRFVAHGHSVTVYARSNHIQYDQDEYQGVRLVKLPTLKHKYLDTPIHTTISVFHTLINRPDVIQLYGVGNALWLPFLRLARRPVVIVVDGLDWKRAKWQGFARWFLHQSENWAVSWSDAYIVDSEAVVAYYRSQYVKPPIYIAYGANIPPTTNESSYLLQYGLQPSQYILFVGRLVPEKGVHYLLDAFKNVNTNMHLVIVGDNIHDQSYVNKLKETNDPRVKFLGFVYGEGYKQLNSHAYIYVQPSDLEGTSPALLGAMGHGNCVLVSDIPENLETIGDSGVSFTKGDSTDLTRALQELCNSPEQVAEFKVKAQNRVRTKYNWDVIAEQYEQLFNSLLERK